jgi:hypothetical protein
MTEVKICTTCKTDKPLSDFTATGYRCQDCRIKTVLGRNQRYKREGRFRRNKLNHRYKHQHEPRYWISERISQYKVEDPNIPVSNLTVDYLVQLFEKQEGKCYYSGEKIFFGLGREHAEPKSASLDRLDPKKGYTIDNVVWCSYRVNTMKGNLNITEFYMLMTVILSRGGVI